MRKSFAVFSFVVTSVFSLQSEEWLPVGAKGVGMGGAQVAIPEGSQAVLVNPAALGSEDKFDISLPISVTAGAEGKVVEDADRLINNYDDGGTEQAFNNLKNGTGTASQSISSIVKFLASDAKVLDKEGQGILANVNGAMSMRYGRIGITAGVRYFVGGSVKYDSSTFSPTDGYLISPGTVTRGSLAPTTNTTNLSEATSIQSSISTNGANDLLTSDIQKLVEDVKGSDTTRSLTTDEANLLTDIVKDINKSNDGSTTKSTSSEINNQTGIEIKGLEIQEVGIAYAFSFLEDRLHVAPTVKLLRGEAVHKNINLADSTSEDKDIGDELTKGNTEGSTQIGLDLGVLYRVNEKLSLGLVGKDLTSPSFDTTQGADIELEPVIRAGVGYEYLPKPGWRGVVAADLDIIKSDISVLNGGESQQGSLGISQELMGWLSLRAGLAQNFAGESDGVIYSGGIGVQISKFYLDISGSGASDKVNVDGDSYATRGGFGLTLGWNANF